MAKKKKKKNTYAPIPTKVTVPKKMYDYQGVVTKIDTNRLREVLTMETDAVHAYVCHTFPQYEVTLDVHGNIYVDRGAKILGVAHRDSYGQDYGRRDFHFAFVKDRLYNASLDDRIGVYALTDLLMKFELEYDILITTDEECGNTTANNFIIPEHLEDTKEYLWMFEFDRRGEDVVTYQYKNTEWLATLRKYFKRIGSGSFSDISALSDLGICGVNIGCGYHDEHDPYSYLVLKEFYEQVSDFVEFYEAMKDTKFKHTPTPAYTKTTVPRPKYENDWKNYENYRYDSHAGWVKDEDSVMGYNGSYGLSRVSQTTSYIRTNDWDVCIPELEYCLKCGHPFDHDEDKHMGICGYCWDAIMDYEQTPELYIGPERYLELMDRIKDLPEVDQKLIKSYIKEWTDEDEQGTTKDSVGK